MNAEAKLGGVVLRVDGALMFVPASVAMRLAPLPQIARVPGAPADLLGITLESGRILPVIAIGSSRPEMPSRPPSLRVRGGPDEPASMVVCAFLGEEVGLVGAEIVRTGIFETAGGDDVTIDGETVRSLDLASLYARVQAGPWAGRWRG
jgi:chemotaxis signal transduction protein